MADAGALPVPDRLHLALRLDQVSPQSAGDEGYELLAGEALVGADHLSGPDEVVASSSAAIASRSPQKPNKLTHKHNALNHLFHALVKARGHSPEPVSEAAQARSRKQQEDLGQEE